MACLLLWLTAPQDHFKGKVRSCKGRHGPLQASVCVCVSTVRAKKGRGYKSQDPKFRIHDAGRDINHGRIERILVAEVHFRS